MATEFDKQGLVLSADAKPRLKWTRQLHESFVDAVNQLGGADKATPKSLMRAMGTPGLTLYHLKSHLQKYRLAKNQNPNTSNKKQDTPATDYRPTGNTATRDDKNIISQSPYNGSRTMMQMQMEVQRKLQDQLEVQKHLQLRIEAQGKYLQSVLRKAQETLAGYSSNSLGVEAAKAELSELVSAVDTECLGSSCSQPAFSSKQLQNADCSTDSCLTSPERNDVIRYEKQQKLESSDCNSYNSSEETQHTNPNSGSSQPELQVAKDIDLNR